MKDIIPRISLVLAGGILIVFLLYGSYWTAKTLSYSFFYRGMVERTVRNMVKPECFK